MFVTGSLSRERRWPNFSRGPTRRPAWRASSPSGCSPTDDTLGALNLYSTQPDAFDEQDIAHGSVFAAHAAVALTPPISKGQPREQEPSPAT